MGATINQTGALVIEAEHLGADSLLSQIVALVSQAQRSPAPLQKLADRVAAWFVPTVIAIAIAAFIVWWLFGPEPRLAYALVNAVAVLIIACPCALGFATPISIMVASGRGAQLGVLFRDAEAIETLRNIDTLVLDKTGTLTRGQPTLNQVIAFGDFSNDVVLAGAAALERASEHPLARAIVDGVLARGVTPVEVLNFDSVSGQGVIGNWGERRLALGNEALMRAQAAAIATLQKGGHRVAMAGDGINDAPALAQADVGIAMGTGTDIAIESAQVTLVGGDLRGLVRARQLSEATVRNIRQNLFFAFGYNTLGISLAAGVLYPLTGWLLSPLIAAIAMSLSSISVISNALRLRTAS